MTVPGILFPALCLLLPVSAYEKTYTRELPSGTKVVCDCCPPGFHLRAHCTENRPTECRPCSTGFYTEFWNYIPECLPCDLCALNQEEKQSCTHSQNRVCQCKEGYYWLSHFCKKHSVCPTGHGIKSKGTPTKDTQCEQCAPSHYAAGAAGHKQCTPHTTCRSDERLVISGTTWHDNLCATCNKLTAQGWAGLIKPVLSELFNQQKQRRLQRLIHHLYPRGNGSSDGVLPCLQQWLSVASDQQLAELPNVLVKANIRSLADKVEHKVKKLQEEAKYCSNSII